LSAGTIGSIVAPNTNLALEHVYALNGLAQFDITSAGGVPFEWSDVTARYAKYCVLRARYIVRFYDPTQDGLTVGIQWRGTSTTGQGQYGIWSRPRARTKELSNTGEQTVTFRGEVSMPQAFGVPLAEYRSLCSSLVTNNPGVTAGTGSSDPNFTFFLRCYAISGVPSTATTVQLEFRVEWDVEVTQLLN
jgi:hypothetical protein